MKIGSWDFEALSKVYGVKIIDRTYLPREGRYPAMNVLEIDLDDLPEDARFWMTRHDGDGLEYHVFRVHGGAVAGRTYSEWEPTAEDYTEWCAASCGMTYNAYIGKPWLD